MRHPPSYAPFFMAVGLMCTLWGAVTTWLVSAAGLILVAYASFRWIAETHQGPHAASLERAVQAEEARNATVKLVAARASELRMTPWLHRYASLVAVSTLGLVITGALFTSNSENPTAFLQKLHLVTAASVGVLTLGLALLARGPAWILLAAIVAQSLLGLGRGPVIGALHALIAQLLFAGAVSLAVITHPRWSQPAQQAADSPRLSLRNLSLGALALLIAQVSLGAAYRHKAMGVLPHIAGALVVTIALLLLAILVTNLYPEHAGLRPAAKTLIGITFAQVMLGMAAFITRLMMAEGTLPVVIIGVSHVATGSLTLGTTTVLTLLIRRCLTPRRSVPA